MSGEKSVHSANIEEIHSMPISEIIRPIPSELDEKKVDSIADVLKVKKFASKLWDSNPKYFFFNFVANQLQLNFDFN